MREILFRGKRVDNGKWVYGYLYVCGRNNAVEISNYDNDLNMERMTSVVIPETVGQYIGFTDKNGNKIFEGDVVRINYSYDGDEIDFKGEVFFDNGEFSIKEKAESASIWNYLSEEIEAIGNIHDNSELIESEVETE